MSIHSDKPMPNLFLLSYLLKCWLAQASTLQLHCTKSTSSIRHKYHDVASKYSSNS